MTEIDDTPQARIIPSGEPVEGGISLYDGSTEGALTFLAGCSTDDLAELSVWTKGRIWSPEEFLAESGSAATP